MKRAALIATVAIALAACGGNGGRPLTKEQYATKADAICAKVNEQQKALGTPSGAELAGFADRTLSILDGAIADLDRLKPPPKEQATAAQWLEQVRKLRDDVRQIRDKAKAGDRQALQQIAATSQADNARANALATELGMSVCNKD